MIKDIIKQNMEYWNLSSKELSLKTNISEQTISKILNGSQTLNSKTAMRLEKALNLPDMILLKVIYNQERMNKRDNDKGIKQITEFLEEQDPFKLLSKSSLVDKASELLGADEITTSKKYYETSVKGFKKYKNKPLAYLWMSLLEKKHANKRSSGVFKKSSWSTIFKNVMDIMIDNTPINKRIDLLEKYLDKSGIILVNAPFIPDSTINGAAFLRNNQRFIFLSDKSKKEYSYIFSLVHELLHFYGPANLSETQTDKEAVKIIKGYFEKYNKTHKELLLSFETFKSSDKDKWDKLYDQTKLKVNFGDYTELFK